MNRVSPLVFKLLSSVVTPCSLAEVYRISDEPSETQSYTEELHLSGLIGTASHPVMMKIPNIEFFFENRLNWLFEFRLLLFTLCICLYIFRPRLIL